MALTRINNNSLSSVTAAGLPQGSVLQVVSNNWNESTGYPVADGTGNATGIAGSSFSVVPTQTYVNITAKKANSLFLVSFDGNMSVTADGSVGDWIAGFGFLVDPAGGTSWQNLGSGTNTANTNNVKFFISRSTPAATGNDQLWAMPLAGSVGYESSCSAGDTLRFAIEYFHYDSGDHDQLIINQRDALAFGNDVYSGNLASTITVMEIAGA